MAATEPLQDKAERDESRQEAVYGREAMERLANLKVLVSGINGLGIETVKNVVLASVKSLTIHDSKEVTMRDLGAQFYLTPEDVGKNRATASLAKMQELNPSVAVDAIEGELSDEVLTAGGYGVVVVIDTTEADALRINEWCRAQEPQAQFIRADVNGLFGRVFCDFGDDFVCKDPTGENPRSAIVESITNDAEGEVTCVFSDEGRHDLEDGNKVIFTEVRGMDALNNAAEPHTVKVINPFKVSIGDTSGLPAYEGGGIMVEVKEPKHLHYKSLADATADPGEFLESDYGKFGRPNQLHVLYQALDRYVAETGSLPAHCDDAARDALAAHVKAVAADLPDDAKLEEHFSWDEAKFNTLVAQLAHGSRAVLNPMAAIFGGIVGQEVAKAATRKFHPIFQWFYYDATEVLPAEWPLDAAEYATEDDRYDDQIVVVGKSLNTKLQELNYFLVGAGALGCEFLKNFALMGIACGGGKVTVTDDDVIERSNLSRQFLFRNWDINESKSLTASNAVKTMNPAFNVAPLTERVSPNTENVFHDEFWSSLSGVCNALDNVKARLYVDSRCVFFNKPLLESGTLGTKCNVQVVIPHITENYGASVDPPEKAAPQCTVHSFPHNIDHCLVWARSEFVGHFDTSPAEAKKFVEKGPEEYVKSYLDAGASRGDVLQQLRGDATWGGGIAECVANKCETFEDCVAWARNKFEMYCSNMIRQLTFLFPEDATNKETGKLFWSPPKRFPRPLGFDPSNEFHMDFIIAAANLRAKTYGITPPENNRDPALYVPILEGVEVPEFTPSSDVKIETDEDADGNDNGDGGAGDADDNEVDTVLSKIPDAAGLEVTPDEFEKDDETNFHIDFIRSLANLRAMAYGIEPVDQLTARLKAGRIIPAIATTTAMATGFVCIELYKVHQFDVIEPFRNTFANLALPVFAMSEPMPPKKETSRVEKRVPNPQFPDYVEEIDIAAVPEGFTVWDSIKVDKGDLTIQEFADHFAAEYNIKLTSLAMGTCLLYNSFTSPAERMAEKITDVYTRMQHVELPTDKDYLIPACMFEDDQFREVVTPEIIYKFR